VNVSGQRWSSTESDQREVSWAVRAAFSNLGYGKQRKRRGSSLPRRWFEWLELEIETQAKLHAAERLIPQSSAIEAESLIGEAVSEACRVETD
jgi:hypothetical protein